LNDRVKDTLPAQIVQEAAQLIQYSQDRIGTDVGKVQQFGEIAAERQRRRVERIARAEAHTQRAARREAAERIGRDRHRCTGAVRARRGERDQSIQRRIAEFLQRQIAVRVAVRIMERHVQGRIQAQRTARHPGIVEADHHVARGAGSQHLGGQLEIVHADQERFLRGQVRRQIHAEGKIQDQRGRQIDQHGVGRRGGTKRESHFIAARPQADRHAVGSHGFQVQLEQQVVRVGIGQAALRAARRDRDLNPRLITQVLERVHQTLRGGQTALRDRVEKVVDRLDQPLVEHLVQIEAVPDRVPHDRQGLSHRLVSVQRGGPGDEFVQSRLDDLLLRGRDVGRRIAEHEPPFQVLDPQLAMPLLRPPPPAAAKPCRHDTLLRSQNRRPTSR